MMNDRLFKRDLREIIPTSADQLLKMAQQEQRLTKMAAHTSNQNSAPLKTIDNKNEAETIKIALFWFGCGFNQAKSQQPPRWPLN